MSSKRALIVDDSKTALVRLRKMLERFDLQIDTALSAEEALSYLSYRTPAVVFMDHMMPGLDGFEALKIIKSNPHTAMIPIVMYTSKSGDLYVGQARALGAIDVLSKDVIQPSTLENVLRVIGIIRPDKQDTSTTPAEPPPAAETEPPPPAETGTPARTDPSTETQSPVPTERLPAESPESSDELQVIRRQVARMLEINITKVRHEISSQSRLLYKRLNRDIKELKERKEPPPPPPPEPVTVEPEPGGAESGNRARSRWPEFLILIVLAVVVYQLISLHGSVTDNVRQTQQVQTQLADSLADAEQRANTDTSAPPSAQFKPLNLVAALQWGLNQNNQFEFGSQALGDENLVVLQELVSRLDAAGFTGVIRLAIHFGDFCVVHGERGEWKLPESDVPLQECRRMSDEVDSMSLQDHMSVAFINYLVSSPVLNSGSIEVDVKNFGFDEPKFSYPEPTVSAAEWNSVAGLNNRVEIRLQADLAR